MRRYRCAQNDPRPRVGLVCPRSRVGLVYRCVRAVAALICFVAAPLAFAANDDESKPPSDLVVHEWGTLLAVQGSNGVALDGMYHEEHGLPDFVHARSRDQLYLPAAKLKGETPVIYFYTKTKQVVSVDVRFPTGMWTQWYPQANYLAPGLGVLGSELEPRNGRITWNVELIPPSEGGKAPQTPTTQPDALWNFARDVDAAYVRTNNHAAVPKRDEFERFIFYRGLGRAQLPLEMRFDEGGTLRASSSDGIDLLHIFVIRVENGVAAYKYFPRLDAGQSISHVIPELTDALPVSEFSSKIANDMATRLTGHELYPKEARLTTQAPEAPPGPFLWSGLHPKEARAMVNTWRNSYFETEGIRVLFVLPQKWTDAAIPMKISPQPCEVVRVMVGRLEVLTPDREVLAENAVRDLASPDAASREEAFQFLREQGRYVEPIVRRVLSTTQDDEARVLCQRLLLTDFVTELRAAVHSATDGSRVREDPLYVRAKLASLLRNVGQADDARSEAKVVLTALAAQKEPPMSYHGARHYLRAKARALDGSGDDAAAAQAYAKFIRYGSQVGSTPAACTGCHKGNDAPRDMAWYREWWAGKSFANAVSRSGTMDQEIKAQELAVEKNEHDLAALMMLAYLREAKGQGAAAEKAWARLGVTGGPVVASARPGFTSDSNTDSKNGLPAIRKED
jgi:hypothetical protein